jgi:hypothetical protein
MTVGPGFAPDLLTLPGRQALAGLTVGTSNKLLRVGFFVCDARCTSRTAALLDKNSFRSLRLFDVPMLGFTAGGDFHPAPKTY